MDLICGIIFSLLIVGAYCDQIDYSSLINSTQQLQDIERGGVNYHFGNDIESRAGGGRPFYAGTGGLSTNVPPTVPYNPDQNLIPSLPGNSDRPFYAGAYPTLYPTLPNSTISNRPFYAGKPTSSSQNTSLVNEKFLNQTRKAMSSGLCTKEVPTASLLRRNEVSVAGNGSNPTLSLIQVCCEGYQRDAHIFRKCNPICSMGCANGICTAPETCLCYPNFTKNYNGQCILTCPSGCENGICNPDNTCHCNEGFTPEPNGKFCTVKCREGFRAINGVCQPFCSRGCENGVCVAPEQCECRFGWTLDGSRSKCVPKCDRTCLNGFCSSPNKCSCKEGYMTDLVDHYRCNPVCNPPCENAMCSGPNMCLCYQGYVKDRNVKSGNKCVRL